MQVTGQNFAARCTGPGSGVRDVINVSQALLNPRCAPSIPQRPSKSVPYSINTLKRCSDEADGQTGFIEEWEQYLQSIREETATPIAPCPWPNAKSAANGP